MSPKLIAVAQPEPVELLPEELRLSGTSFMNDFPLRWEDTPEAFRILAAKTPVAGLTAMTLVISGFFAAFWIATHRLAPGEMTLGWEIVVVLVGMLAIGGPLIGHLARIEYRKKQSPFLEFDKRSGRVSLLAGRHCFQPGEVVCVQSLTGPALDGDGSELNVIVQQQGKRQRIFAGDARRQPPKLL